MNKVHVGQCGSSYSGALKLSQKVDYGLFLLATLAQNDSDKPHSIQSIANNNGLSFSFLQKVAAYLKKAGLIKATRGKNGGYHLSKSANQISLKEIIEAIEGPIRVMHCLDINTAAHRKCKRMSFCQIRTGLKKINNEIQNSLLEKKLTYFIS